MRRTVLIFINLTCIACFCIAQSVPVKLPAVVPPPAEAASLGRYGDVPVDMSSGNVNISVPIYEIKTPRFTIPISLSYNSSGVKVDDIASWVGLGWTLNAGGLITRSVRGLDDFLSGNSKGYYYHSVPEANSLSQMVDWQFLDDVSNGLIDEEPDYFFFNFLNHTGKYVFDENKKPLIIQYQDPLRIQYNATVGTFSILDGEGNQYIFSDKESTQSYYTTLSTDPFPNHQQQYTSSWYLSQIISFDKSDTIRFSYYTDYEQVQTSYNYSEAVGEVYQCSTPLPPTYESYPQSVGNRHDGEGGEISSQTFIRSNPLRLQEITFRNGKVVFSSSKTRQDATVAKLDYITVYSFDLTSNSYVSLKKINLNYSYYNTTYNNKTSYRLKLESVATQGSANEVGGKYTFEYDQTMLPPINNNAKDLFGYYNGHLDNLSLIPTQLVSYQSSNYTVGSANRNTDPAFIQAGVLKKIFYPTGGRTEFEYEPNSYADQGVQSINEGAVATGIMNEVVTTNFTTAVTAQAQLTAHISRFDYPDVQTRPMVSLTNLTTGKIIYSNSLTNASTDFNHSDVILIEAGQSYQLVAKAFDNDHVGSSINLTWDQLDPNLVSKYGGGLRIKRVKSYESDGAFSKGELYKYGNLECGYGYLPSKSYLFNAFNAERNFYLGCSGPISCVPEGWMRMTFNASSIYDVFNLSGAPVSYTQVTKYPVDADGNTLGKTVYELSLYKNSNIPGTQSYYEGDLIVNSGWAGGLLLSQTDYSLINTAFTPVRKVVNNYSNVSLGEVHGLKVGYTASISGCYNLGPSGVTYYFVTYPIYAGTSLRTSTAIYDYSKADPTKYVTKTEQITYDDLEHLQPTKIESNTSNSSTIMVENQYPVNAASISGLTTDQQAALNNLYNQHNITALIQAQTTRNSTPVSLVRNDYKTWIGNLTLPEAMQVQSGNNPLEKRLSFNNYDSKGNLLEQQKAGDVIHSYLWGYNNQYTIAEAINATNAQIAYTSFEADGTGGWTINPGSTIGPFNNGVTGKNTFSGALLKTFASPGNYIVTLWSNPAGSVTVNGMAGTLLNANGPNGWKLFQWTLNNISSITINADNIDEVRLYPQGAQMTTYTYEPLIGMTSQCDINNRITYYEYDGFWRLILVKDQDGNILKKICYNYKGQPENCTVNVTPQWSATGNYQCSLDANGQNTGYQQREEKDINPGSPTYNQLHWVDNGYNAAACPLPVTCDYYSCAAQGEGFSCINGECEYGFLVYTDSYWDYSMGEYMCTYHYEYSDGSWSENYVQYSTYPCY